MTMPYSFKSLLTYTATAVLAVAMVLTNGFALAQDCPSQEFKRSSQTPIVKDMVNPHPDAYDFELPMPCGGKLFLRHVCIAARSFLDDSSFSAGCTDCRRKDEGFMEPKRETAISGAFTLDDLPEPWRAKLAELARKGDGLCPAPDDGHSKALYYFIGKYEISNWQWQTVMAEDCPGWDKAFTAEDPRPKTDISWFEAVEFTRRYTQWLLKNRPNALPSFPAGRHGFIRLPTEAEWEYAARGGHMVTAADMDRNQFFPMDGHKFSDFAVYTQAGGANPPEKLAWIGTKCPNPLGLFDAAGNAAEIMLDPFRYFTDSRQHGATGGFVIKGGSYSKGRPEIMPGRREEMPFFLDEGEFRSNDLGLRVVLSGIVTPQNRIRDLREQWARISERNRRAELKPPSRESAVDEVRGKILIAEFERRAAEAGSEVEREKFLSAADYLKTITAKLGESGGGSIETLIWKVLFSIESLHKYVVLRGKLESELEMLKKMRLEPLPESEIESVNKNILEMKEQISQSDTAIDYLAQSYMADIRDGQKYSQAVIDRHLDHTFQSQIIDESLRSSLTSRMELFREHLAEYTSDPDSLKPEKIIHDIVSDIAP